MSGESDMEYSSGNECEYDDYYNVGVPDVDIEPIDRRKTDPEHLEYACLDTDAVEKLLNETVEQLSNVIKVSPSLAKVLLLEHKWRIADVVEKYRQNAAALMIFARIKPPVNASGSSSSSSTMPIGRLASASTTAADATVPKTAAVSHSQLSSSASSPLSSTSTSPATSSSSSSNSSSQVSLSHISAAAPASASSRSQPNITHLHLQPSAPSPPKAAALHCCPVCIVAQPADAFFHLACAHSFCRDCWTMHFETQVQLGCSTAIGCMATECQVRVPEELVLQLLTKPAVRDKYQQFAFLDYVKSHPELRFCPGPNCQTIVQSADPDAPKKATCTGCATSFCYRCGTDYHAPTACRVIRRWLTKCADDSETANYISAHTKDCPKCHICIEKNGGCNHMQCFNCKHDFCWMCVGDWKTHGSEYYECSRYKENPNIANESVHVQAREALKKYLHYYERWENHSKSLQLEQQTVERLKLRINKKVMKSLGTWIDWQHLFNAAALLARCRYTLQYTYPYAYFMEAGPRKELFEYQQAQLEAEIENLSWKIERAETTDRGDLENQMDVAEKRRITLIKDFFPTDVSETGQQLRL